jgi:hypothetical protein
MFIVKEKRIKTHPNIHSVMRFDKWFKYLWTINLSFLILSLLAAAYYIFFTGTLPLESVLENPFDLISHISVFPAAIVFLFFLPFFLSGNIILIIGILEVYTSKKTVKSKILWIFPMIVFGVTITVIYYFFGGRNRLTD